VRALRVGQPQCPTERGKYVPGRVGPSRGRSPRRPLGCSATAPPTSPARCCPSLVVPPP